MAIEKLQCARNSPVSVIGPNIIEPGEKFSNKAFRRIENAILIFAFANTVLYQRAILILFT